MSSRVTVDPILSIAECKSTRPLLNITLGEALREKASERPDELAIFSDHEDIEKNFRDFDADVSRLANALNGHLELVVGDHVAIWSANCYLYMVTEFACARAGITLWLFDPHWSSKELEHGLVLAKPRVLFCPGNESVQQAKVVNFVTVFNEAHNGVDTVVTLGASSPEKIDYSYNVQHHWSIEELTADSSASWSPGSAAVKPEDSCFVLFTSGSSGPAKAVVLNHLAVLNNNILTHERFNYDLCGSRYCLPLPLFHGFASLVIVPCLATRGVSIVLCDYVYSAITALKVVEKYSCNILASVPTMLIDTIDAIKDKEATHCDLSSLKCIVTGASAVPVEVVNRLIELVPSIVDLIIVYGATELGPVVTCSQGTLEQNKDNIGTPLDGVTVRIIDKTGKVLPLYSAGQLQVRTPFRMKCYFMNEIKTKEAFDEEGWYNSGDIAKMDSRGRLQYLCRSNEVLGGGSVPVFVCEVEQALYTMPSVRHVAVFGVSSPRDNSSELCAWLQLDKGATLGAKDVRDYLAHRRMSAEEIPKHVLFASDHLPPLTGSGKVAKNTLSKKTSALLAQVKQYM